MKFPLDSALRSFRNPKLPFDSDTQINQSHDCCNLISTSVCNNVHWISTWMAFSVPDNGKWNFIEKIFSAVRSPSLAFRSSSSIFFIKRRTYWVRCHGPSVSEWHGPFWCILMRNLYIFNHFTTKSYSVFWSKLTNNRKLIKNE